MFVRWFRWLVGSYACVQFAWVSCISVRLLCVWCVVVCGALVRMSVWVSVYVIHAHGAIWCIYVTSHVEKGIKECLQTLTVSAL